MSAMRYSRPPMMPSPFIGAPSAPFARMPAPFPRPGGAGGLLARLFSRGQPPTVVPSPSGMPLLQNTAANAATTANTGSGFIGMLNNVQKMLGIAQNVVPMVQQYGPLVRNLPGMIRIFRELKPADKKEENPTQPERAPAEEKKRKSGGLAAKKRPVPRPKREELAEKRTPAASKPSAPKLYI